MATSILISEVGPRDGLQSIDSILPTATKKQWVEKQYEAGAREIEVGSFVPAKLLPQLADTAEVVEYAKTLENLNVAVLAPNLRGVKDAVAAGADKIAIPFSCSESHSRRNVNKSHEEMFQEIETCQNYVAQLTDDERPALEVSLSTAFGCTIEGAISARTVVAAAEQFVEMGVDEVGLSDTTGMGDPKQLESLAKDIWHHCGREKLTGVHLHNTRGQGLANALKAVELGFTTLDASLGGIGGCPFAPGASGNIVTEDLVFMLHSMAVETGIDLPQLLEVRKWLQDQLPNESLYGFTVDAGIPPDWPFSNSS
ncbi:MAG: hydroxymethylglutaryl-CoA lyase [Gammaproteobacteria bacterium]|nr:hydroxymethylglutaryl-CoA lyase [Gammaproteobacteria bacterium]